MSWLHHLPWNVKWSTQFRSNWVNEPNLAHTAYSCLWSSESLQTNYMLKWCKNFRVYEFAVAKMTCETQNAMHFVPESGNFDIKGSKKPSFC